MGFYKLWFDDSGNSWQLAIDENKLEIAQGDFWAFSRGEKCQNLTPVPCRIDVPGEAVDFNRDAVTTTPIVSQRLADLLQRIAPNDIQLIPAILDAPGSWVILNVLSLVEAIDYENSVITFHDATHPTKAGKPSGIVRLIVIPEKIIPHDLCRVKDFSVAIIVSALVKEECQRHGMTNMKFIPTTVSEWNDYAADTNAARWCYRRSRKPTASATEH